MNIFKLLKICSILCIVPLSCGANDTNNTNNTVYDYYEYNKKVSKDEIIENFESIFKLKSDINEVFGSSKYDKDMERNLFVKKELLSVIKKLKEIFSNLNNLNCRDIENYFNDIFNTLMSNLAGTQYRYKKGLINSTKPYEVIVDLISYCVRLQCNAELYIQYP